MVKHGGSSMLWNHFLQHIDPDPIWLSLGNYAKKKNAKNFSCTCAKLEGSKQVHATLFRILLKYLQVLHSLSWLYVFRCLLLFFLGFVSLHHCISDIPFSTLGPFGCFFPTVLSVYLLLHSPPVSLNLYVTLFIIPWIYIQCSAFGNLLAKTASFC